MTRIMGVNVLPEMLALWLVETAAGFLLFYIALSGTPLLVPEGRSAGVTASVVVSALLLATVVGLVGLAMGLYRVEIYARLRWLLLKAVLSAAVSLPLAWLTARGMGIDTSMLADYWPLKMLLAWSLLLFVTRVIYFAAMRMDLFVRRVAVLGAPQAVARTIAAVGGMPQALYRIEAVSAPSDRPSAGPAGQARLPDGLWGVVVAGQNAPIEVPTGARRFDIDTFWEDHLGRVNVPGANATSTELRDVEADPGAAAGPAQAPAASRPEEALRRLLDIVLSSLLLLATAPVLLITALLIRLESPGPVIYRQDRVGLGGRVFTLWKFRSMWVDAERHGPSWATVHDPRVTLVGRFIRKVRIDELPQLVNILRGEMSMVGPRPERPHFVEQLERTIPSYGQRALVKPGLTGWAQVRYPYGASVEDAREKLSYDLYYVKHRNLAFDLLILLSTVRVILFQEGAR
jgi:exopolysaccharide biosynthesis polyprenyl glycosylphosphotransferase